ncbi:carbon monoxide dehydrogenase [Nocardioides mangrovicus]|uniref:Carbon monoxide dehydrogenase n=1 Tax=Nocardioides mangrovicus TaxID=2478913 RepID=A0A3L8NWL2_9ACTN|nr:SRPBCC family protein [Nocardioides mangrovicus]RLV47545.1 carbon monoxide dehydrogenase [Nocardioides mangrovicus]
MELTHRFTVPADVEETWQAFNDIGSVAECFPGAQVTSVEDDSFQGSVKVKLGPIALVYNGSGTFVEKDASAHTMRIEAKGKDKRGNGTAGANVTATLTGNGSSTDVEVVTDLAITGKPAQFGRGVMQDVSDKLLAQFVECLKTKVGGAPDAPAAEPTPAPASAPAPTATPATTATTAIPGPTPIAAAGTTQPPTPVPTRAQDQAQDRANDDALDLGATVLPVLVKGYWKQALAALAVLAVLVAVIRRRR